MSTGERGSAPVAVGDVIADKYRIERILGVGGMGVVVAAQHLVLLEPRAIKFMLPEALAVPTAAERFLREARAAARLKSEHVAKVFDMGTLPNGAPFMVMEYLEGKDLDAHLESHGPLPIREVALYALQVCEALAEAHGLGIVHRDLKPANLFLTRANDGAPRIKVLDFGISKLTKVQGDAADAKTTTGAIMGSPQYMAPEQIRGEGAVGPRADLWAMGIILYELVTGKRPFEAGEVMQILAKILESKPTPPSIIAPHVPRALEAVILHCLEKAPEKRPADVVELARALVPFAGKEGAALVDRVGRVLTTTAAPKQQASPDALKLGAYPQTTKVPRPVRAQSAPDDKEGDLAASPRAHGMADRSKDAPNAAPGAHRERSASSWSRTGALALPGRKSRSPMLWIAGGIGLALLAAGLGVVLMRGAPAPVSPDALPSAASTGVSPVTVNAAATEEVSALAPTVTPEASAEPEPPASASASPPAASTTPIVGPRKPPTTRPPPPPPPIDNGFDIKSRH